MIKKADELKKIGLKRKQHRQSKYFTIMLIPHSSGHTRSLRIPVVAFYMVLSVIVVSVICFTSFVLAAKHFKSAAESAYMDLEQSAEINSLLNQEKLNLNNLLIDEKKGAEKVTQQQREFYEERIKYYDEKAKELEQKLDELNEAKEEIFNQLSQKPYLPEISLVTNTMGASEPVFLNTDAGAGNYDLDLDARFERLTAEVDNQLVDFDHLLGEMEKIKPYLDNYPTAWPARGIVTSEHSYRANPFSGKGTEYHAGLDIAAGTGTNVRATGGGKVVYAGWYSSYGYMVDISHGFGLVTRYAHNSSLLVKAGDTVARGDIIAKSGSTGRSTGPHVHYEVLKNGTSVNPRSYLN